MRRPTSGRIGELADQVAIARIVRMHRHRGIAQHRLRPRGGDRDEPPRLALDRIADVPQRAAAPPGSPPRGRRSRSAASGPSSPAAGRDRSGPGDTASTNTSRTARGQALVHGEALARPVQRGAQPAQLPRDGAAGFRLPLPDALDERVAPQSPGGRLPCSASSRSTTICVAMPAWSVPGCHSASRPCMRRQRISVSCTVKVSAWPMCRLPVTFGGGIMMVKGVRVRSRDRRRMRPRCSQPS